MHLSLEELQRARLSLKGKALYTPLVPVDATPILLKAENLQPSGSFKIRGALHSMAGLTGGVVAYSTGNHAQSVAMAARQQGLSATIVMSPDAPAFKLEATRRLGAEVVMAEPTSQARRLLAEEIARTERRHLIPPYDHPAVMAGQGTIGLEILEQCAPAAIFVPIGGGGLIAGIAAAVKQSAPDVRVIGVEPELENDAWQSFHRGERVALPTASDSIADAIRVQMLGDLTFPLIRQYVDEIVTVSEEEIAGATVLAAERARLLLEPAGALGLAAALAYRGALPPDRSVVAIASGGNMTLDRLWQLR